MELGDREKEREMPSSFGYNPPHKDSSSKFSPANTVSGLRRDQTLDHHNHLYLQNHHPPNPHQSTNKPRREYQEIDQDPFAVASPSPIAVATGGTSISIRPHTEPPSPPQGQQHTPSPTPQPQSVTAIISASAIRYRECLKNHAASMGGHVVDGCGEFMPGGEEGTPGHFRCAACECHRNFHLKEVDGEPQYTPSHYYSGSKTNGHRAALPRPQHHAIPQPNPVNLHHRFSYCISSAATTTTITTAGPTQPVMMAFGGGIPEESSSEDLTMIQHSDAVLRSARLTSSNKRFRTKFTQQQKDKMMELAEKLGWRIQKQDEQEVIQLCAEAGVTRKAFKVWMHNNKQAMKKQQR